MKTTTLIFLALAIGASPSSEARRPAASRWQVTRSTDPITGRSTCIVAAMDMAGGLTFSRIGALYPIVENDSEYGLLVGVSSGGRVRVPTGDILWRVDGQPFRTLKAADNPAPPADRTAAGGTNQPMRDAMALAAKFTATSTLASGDTARAMLAEMLSGTGLIFRSAAAPDYGLPGAGTAQVGQITKDGLKPFPLDASFRKGVQDCGVDPNARDEADAPR